MLQQFVGTTDLEGVFAAADEVFAGVQLARWQLRAFRYYYIPSPPIGVAGIVIEPTDDLLALQRNLIDAIAPYAVQTGTAAAFASADEGRDIQELLIEYVATFVGEAAGGLGAWGGWGGLGGVSAYSGRGGAAIAAGDVPPAVCASGEAWRVRVARRETLVLSWTRFARVAVALGDLGGARRWADETAS